MPLAIRTDVIDEILAIALHPAFDCYAAKLSVDVLLNLTESPEAHTYIIKRENLKKMLEICERKQIMVREQTSQSLQGKKEDPMVANVLKYVTLTIDDIVHTISSMLSHTMSYLPSALA